MIRAKIIGGDRLARRLRALPAALKKPITREIDRGATLVHAAAVRAIQGGPKTGRIYKRRSVRHQASAPGQAPATDTGALVRSIHIEPDPDGLGAAVVAAAEHAVPLEFGSRHVAARPFLFPAFEGSKAAIRRAIADAVNAALKRAGKG